MSVETIAAVTAFAVIVVFVAIAFDLARWK